MPVIKNLRVEEDFLNAFFINAERHYNFVFNIISNPVQKVFKSLCIKLFFKK